MGPLEEQPPDSLALADNGGDLEVSPISHTAIAQLCVDCVEAPTAACATPSHAFAHLRTPSQAPTAARATLCAMSVPEGDGAESWAPLLAKAAAASRPPHHTWRRVSPRDTPRASTVGTAWLHVTGGRRFARLPQRPARRAQKGANEERWGGGWFFLGGRGVERARSLISARSPRRAAPPNRQC